jgi:hypothetical protein
MCIIDPTAGSVIFTKRFTLWPYLNMHSQAHSADKTTQCHNTEDNIVNNYCSENLKTYIHQDLYNDLYTLTAVTALCSMQAAVLSLWKHCFILTCFTFL